MLVSCSMEINSRILIYRVIKIKLFFQRHGVEGLETLIREVHDYTPFKGRVGVPSIETLVLQHVPGLQGHLLSDSLCYFKQLTNLQLKHCVCLRE
jgi:hypothetical protein